MSVTRFRSGRSQVEVVINDQKQGRVLMGYADREAKLKADRVCRFAKEEAPVGKTGDLRSKIRVEQSRSIKGRFTVGYDVVSNAPYSVFVHEGTKPHEIKGKPLLAFFWPKAGQNVVFASVQHPGTKANRFMARAARRAR